MKCQHCGTTCQKDWYFCPKCSKRLETLSDQHGEDICFPSNISNKSKTLAIQLCGSALIVAFCVWGSYGIFGIRYESLVLIGIFSGLHRFYVGKTVSGILYTFTCGLFLVGLISDLLKLEAGNFTDNTGRKLRKRY